MTDTRHTFTIRNTTEDSINFKINKDNYKLSPKEKRTFTYRDCYGTNSNNVKCYDINIRFDYLYTKGYQKKEYTLKNYNSFYFKKKGNGIDLYH